MLLKLIFIILTILKSPELSGITWFELSAVQLGLVVCFILDAFVTFRLVMEYSYSISANDLKFIRIHSFITLP